MAAAGTACEAMWLRQLMSDIDSVPTSPTELHCDNNGAIAVTQDQAFHACAKHIQIKYHYVRECAADGDINVKYIPSAENPADCLTKSLPRDKLRHCNELIGLGPLGSGGVLKDKEVIPASPAQAAHR